MRHLSGMTVLTQERVDTLFAEANISIKPVFTQFGW
jgi:hypothetical protein